MFKAILAPVDTADVSIAERGLQLVAQLAALSNAAVRMIHVLQPAPWRLQEFVPAQFQEERESAALATMRDMAAKANVPMDYFSVTTRIGSVYNEVLAEADVWAADLIVVGSHSPSMSTYLLGSNAQNIVRHAKCSVLVVRTQQVEHGTWLLPRVES